MTLATGWKLARAEWLAGAEIGAERRSSPSAHRTSPLYTDFRKTPPLRFISARASFHPVAKRTDATRTCSPGEER